MTKIIAIANPKGGVGKTTTTLNLATSLGIAEKKVLIIDCDPSGAVCEGVGFSRQDIRTGLFEVFSSSATFSESIYRVNFMPPIDVLPSNVHDQVREIRLVELAKNRVRLSRLLSGLISSGRLSYDYILIDTPPSLDDLVLGALYAADRVVIPLQCGFFAINAVQRLLNLIERVRKTTNTRLKVEGILLNFYEEGTRATAKSLEMARDRFQPLLFHTRIPKNTALGYAAFKQRPAALVDVTGSGARAYLALAEEIMNREAPPALFQESVDTQFSLSMIP